MTRLFTSVSDGQEVLDREKYLLPKPMSRVELSVAAAFGSKPAQPLHNGYERIRLRWMRPARDAQGAMIRESDGSIRLEPRK